MSDSVGTIDIGVGGMTCAACVRRVENGLRKIPGVVDVSVNLATERAHIQLSRVAHTAEITAVRDAIIKLGYEAIDLKPDGLNEAEKRHEHELNSLWWKFVGAATFCVPLLLIAMAPMVSGRIMNMMMSWLAMEYWNWIMLALAIPVQFGFGARFLRLGLKSLFSTSPDMNALILIGTGAAFAFSAVVTIWPSALPAESRHVYFEASAVVISLVLLGKYLETRSRYQASDAMKTLLNLVPKQATVLRDGKAMTIAIDQVLLGDEIEVRPGSVIAVDGVVESGSTYIDESMVTGEPVPVAKSLGDTVVAGTINGNGSIRFRATAVGTNTTLAKIVAFVESAQATKPRIQGLADRIVAYFVPTVLLIATITAIVWLFVMPQGSIDKALVHAVAVLIIACPCAMGLAVPTSVMVGSGKAAQLGILFRSTEAIQSLSEIKAVAFDKTGTLTYGKPELTAFYTYGPFEAESLLAQLSVVESKSEHPLATAIVNASQARHLKSSLVITQFEAIPGSGVDARLSDGTRILVGSAKLMHDNTIDFSISAVQIDQATRMGHGYFFAAVNQQFAAMMVVTDPLKPTSVDAIAKLKSSGFAVALISGDNARTATAVAGNCGIDRELVFAEVHPNQKAAVIKTLQERFQRVAFVGDGINDAPALTVADVGIAMGTGTELAIETADVIAMSGDIQNIPTAIRLARSVMGNIKQNLAWAFGYNIILIPVATGFPKPLLGLSLSPILAGLAMSLSSFFVVTNALRLRAWR